MFKAIGYGNYLRELPDGTGISYNPDLSSLPGDWANDRPETALILNGVYLIIDRDCREDYINCKNSHEALEVFKRLAEIYGEGKHSRGP